MAKLQIKDENGAERVHELADDVTTIGRSSNNTIKITDAKSSRTHFRIEKDGQYFKVIDLGSTNGTKVNGARITSHRLRAGDVIGLGLTTFTYEGPSDGAYEATLLFGKDVPKPAIAPPTPAPAAAPEPPKAKPETPAPVAPPTPAPSAAMEATMLSAPPEPKPKAQEGPKYVLVVLEGKDPGRTIELANEAVTLGRSSSNTIKVEDDAASSYHAEITKAPIGWVISDLGSTNGTRVRAKGANDFEKIVKTPLAAGMQIRIGKTVIEFRNVGEPAADDQLFGTVVLNEGTADKLSDIAERPAKRSTALPMLVIGVVALVFFAVVVALVVRFLPTGTPGPENPQVPPGPVVAQASGKLENGDFSQGTDDRGNPKGWKPTAGLPEVRVVVDKDAERNNEKPDDQHKGLRISKAGASPSTRTFVETMDSLNVDPGKVYELSGAMKNDGDGQFGLRVVWLKGNRELVDHPLTLSGTQQEWKDRGAKVKPPAWADRVRVGVFTEGREGKTYFDNLAWKELPDEKIPDPPAVSYGGITVNFEGTKGAFSVTSAGTAAIEGALLELSSKDGQAVSSLLSAFETQPVTEGGRTTYRGQLFDFMLQRPANYLISAQAGSGGVQMRFAVDRSQGDSGPRLEFYIVGPAARGEIDARLDSGAQKLSSGDGKTLNGLQEILFNAGGTPQVYVNFSSPVTLETRREGERRFVQIAFQGELAFEIAPENVGEKQQFANHSRDLDEAVSKKDWARVYKLADSIEQKYGGKFSEAKDKVQKARGAFEDAFKTVKEDLLRQVETVKQAPTTADDAIKSIERQMAAWIGTNKEQDFRDAKTQIENLKKAGANTVKEEAASLKLNSAQKAYDSGTYQVAVSFCKVILRDFADTKAAKDAQELLAKAEAEQKKADVLNDITDRLKRKVESFVKAGDYQEAIKTVTNDPDYKKHSLELKELNTLLDLWKTKAQ